MFIPRGSRADLGFERYPATTVVMATVFRYYSLWVLPAQIFTKFSGFVYLFFVFYFVLIIHVYMLLLVLYYYIIE